MGGAAATLPWRLAAIGVVLVASYLGCMTPVLLLKRERRGQGRFRGRRCMHLLKTFAGGVVVAVGYAHVLNDARLALIEVTDYPAADVVALAGSLLTLLLSQVIHNVVDRKMRKERRDTQLRQQEAASRAVAADGAKPDGAVATDGGAMLPSIEVSAAAAAATATATAHQQQEVPQVAMVMEDGAPTPLGSPASGEEGLEEELYVGGGGDKHMSEAESIVYAFSKEPLVIAYLMEIAIVFHSVLIGASIGLLTQEIKEVRTLTIAVAVHQFLEGAGLATCILEAELGRKKRRIMFALFSLTTSIGIAIGIGASAVFDPQSRAAIITQGIFNALAAGTLIYIGLVDLLSEEFAKADVVTDLSLQRGMMLATVAGATLMSVLAMYA